MFHELGKSQHQRHLREQQANKNRADYFQDNAAFQKQHSFLANPVRTNQFVSLRPSEVPTYLKQSSFYLGLRTEDDDEFAVPIECFKSDLQITTVAEFDMLHHTLNFWGCNTIFKEVLHYIYNVLDRKYVYTVCSAHERRFPYLVVLRNLRPYYFTHPNLQPSFHLLNEALRSGILDILLFLREQGQSFNEESVLYAIRSGSVPCLRYVLEQGYSESSTKKAFVNHYRGRSTQDLSMIRYCITHNITDVLTIHTSRIAAEAGDVELLSQLQKLRCPFDSTVCKVAAGAGHLHCLQFAHESGVPWDVETSVAAAKGQHMECLTYSVEHGCPADGRVSNFAIENDDIEMLIFAHENLLPWEDDMCMLAAAKGSLRCLRYVHEAGCALSAETCSAAAANPASFHCLKYAHENGALWDVTTGINAAKCYNFPALEYMVERGYTIDTEVGIRALSTNCSLAHVMFMCKHNFPMHTDMCRVAARYGLIHHLQHLHEHGCPWNAATTRDASSVGQIETLKYAAEHGCPVEVVPCSCSVEPDHFECMKYVYDNWDSTFNPIPAIIHDHHQCYEHAYTNGHEWTEAAVVCAARMGKLQFLQFAFVPLKCPYYRYIDKVYAAAVANGHSDCVAFLDTLRTQKRTGMHGQMVFQRKLRALRRYARKRRISVENHITSFLHVLLIDCGIYKLIPEYMVAYGGNKLDSYAWQLRVNPALQIKYTWRMHCTSWVRRICKWMLSPVYCLCLFHVRIIGERLLRNAKWQKMCIRKIRALRRKRRINGTYFIRKTFVRNVWAHLLAATKTEWSKQAKQTEAQCLDIILSK